MIQPMQHLWAPWRMEFIKAPKPSGCFFCEAAAAAPSDDATHLVLARGELTLVILNRYPYNNGHLMIAPNAHLADLEDLPSASANELTALTQRSLRVLRQVLAPQGFNLGINAEDMLGMVDDTISDYRIEARDLQPYTFPPSADLRRAGTRSVFLGYFIPWDVKKHVEVIKRELDWQGDEVEGVPPQYDYEKIECFMQGVRDYLRYLKRGFGRTTHLASIDIRNHRMDRPTAERLVSEYDGARPAALDLFLDILGLSEERFLEIVAPHVVAPHQMPDCSACRARPNKAPWDFDLWRQAVEAGKRAP